MRKTLLKDFNILNYFILVKEILKLRHRGFKLAELSRRHANPLSGQNNLPTHPVEDNVNFM